MRISPSKARHSKRSRRTAVAVVVALTGASLTIGAAYAALNATAYNTTAQTVSSGTLKLVVADNGAGFTTAITNMAPADVVNRYVDLTNSGTLDGRTLTFTAADSNNTKLSSDATNGLHVTITQCSAGTWTPGTGVCSGSTTALLTNAAVRTINTTPASLVAGTVTTGAVLHLQVSITLPDQAETTTNGTLPGSTIQGLTSLITWPFAEVQRAGTTVTS